MEKLNKQQKVSLIKRITAGEVVAINGRIFDGILIQDDGKYFFNGKPVSEKKIEQLQHLEGALIILPDNGRSD